MKLSSETRLLLVMGVFVLIGGGALVLIGRSNGAEVAGPVPTPPPLPKMSRAMFDALVHNGRHIEGSPNARLTIVEFADFQCPWCRHAYNQTIKKYDVIAKAPARLVFYNLPITSAHIRALPAAIAAEAAGRQGKFWPMYDLLFTGEVPHLDVPDLDQDASKLGLNLDRFHQDEADTSVAAAVESDRQTAASRNISEAPTFFLIRTGDPGDPQVAVGATKLQSTLSAMLGPTAVPTAPAASPAHPLPGGVGPAAGPARAATV
jgi:protein-disulfide isomerase